MDLKSAKKIINEMFDLCSQIEDPTLTEAAEGIYNDIQTAKSVEQVITSARELMVFVSEVPDDDFVSEIRAELEEMLITLMEDE